MYLLFVLLNHQCLVQHVRFKSITHFETLRLNGIVRCSILNWHDMWVKVRKARCDVRVSALNGNTTSSSAKHNILILLPDVNLSYWHPTHDRTSIWSLRGTWG